VFSNRLVHWLIVIFKHKRWLAMRSVNLRRIAHHLPSLEQEDFVLAHCKIDIALVVVDHVARKVRSHNAMPSSTVFLVKFFLYILCNTLKKRQCINIRKFTTNQPTKHVTSVYWHTNLDLCFMNASVAQCIAYCCISYGMSVASIKTLLPDILLDLQQ